jgi:TetR/AcrR family transcriptional regulator, regulator of cefoperazone and chloramphenicol sensitivity
MRSLVAAGIARPARDERVRTAFLLANDLAVVLLRRQIARATGIDPLTREGLAAWTVVVMDVYTRGVFAAPGASSSAQQPGKEDRHR